MSTKQTPAPRCLTCQFILVTLINSARQNTQEAALRGRAATRCRGHSLLGHQDARLVERALLGRDDAGRPAKGVPVGVAQVDGPPQVRVGDHHRRGCAKPHLDDTESQSLSSTGNSTVRGRCKAMITHRTTVPSKRRTCMQQDACIVSEGMQGVCMAGDQRSLLAHLEDLAVLPGGADRIVVAERGLLYNLRQVARVPQRRGTCSSHQSSCPSAAWPPSNRQGQCWLE